MKGVVLKHSVQKRKKSIARLHLSPCLSMHAAAELTRMAQGHGCFQGLGLLVGGLTASAHSHLRSDRASLLRDAPQCPHDRRAEIYHQMVKTSSSCHPRFDDQWVTIRPHYQQRGLPSQQLGQMQNLTVILVTFAGPIFGTQEWEVADCYRDRLPLAHQ